MATSSSTIMKVIIKPLFEDILDRFLYNILKSDKHSFSHSGNIGGLSEVLSVDIKIAQRNSTSATFKYHVTC